ncbi:MAG: hypothetical protein J7L38_03100 [Thermoproteales archaeon]|nr:hypothetical protein [Thermoproteales archaeon]
MVYYTGFGHNELARQLTENIGVISPFRAQRKLIVEMLEENRIQIETSTVDAFQGREKDVIIFSVTSTSRMEFPANPHRLNVALTRARKKLIVVGNGKAIVEKAKGTLLYSFLEYCAAKDCIYDWNKKKWLRKRSNPCRSG